MSGIGPECGVSLSHPCLPQGMLEGLQQSGSASSLPRSQPFHAAVVARLLAPGCATCSFLCTAGEKHFPAGWPMASWALPVGLIWWAVMGTLLCCFLEDIWDVILGFIARRTEGQVQGTARGSRRGWGTLEASCVLEGPGTEETPESFVPLSAEAASVLRDVFSNGLSQGNPCVQDMD